MHCVWLLVLPGNELNLLPTNTTTCQSSARCGILAAAQTMWYTHMPRRQLVLCPSLGIALLSGWTAALHRVAARQDSW